MKRYLIVGVTQMSTKCMKRYAALFVIRWVQTGTTMMYHYTALRMATIKNSTTTKCQQGKCRDIKWPSHSEKKKKFGSFLKTEHLTIIAPNRALLSTCSEKWKLTFVQQNLHMNIRSNFTCNRHKLGSAWMSFKGWMAKSTVVHTHQKLRLSNRRFGWGHTHTD